MSRRIITMIMTLLVAPVSMAEGWYGDITYTGSDGDLPSAAFTSVDSSDTGWQLAVGYDLNQHVAFEVGYADYGQQSVAINIPVGFSSLTPNPALVGGQVPGYFNPFSTSFTTGAGIVAIPLLPTNPFSSDITGVRFASIGKVELSPNFSLNLQAGALVPRYKTSRDVLTFDTQIGGTITNIRVETDTNTSSEPELFFGLGVHWSMNSTLGLKLFWEKINDLGNKDTLEQDLDTYNLALRYQF